MIGIALALLASVAIAISLTMALFLIVLVVYVIADWRRERKLEAELATRLDDLSDDRLLERARGRTWP